MVCARCIKTVTGIFQRAGVYVQLVKLGAVELKNKLNEQQTQLIRNDLVAEGFEMLDDRRGKLVEEIKTTIIDLVHYGELDEMKENLSDMLSKRLHRDYSYLSNLFSSVQDTTIEQYFIFQKIEKVKELLVYGEISLSEIAFKMGYSSIAHLSGQFKKITGFTPSQYKNLKEKHRQHLDKL